jgi:prevent-host-death family protein
MNIVHGSISRVRTIPAGEFKQRCLALLDEVGASGEPIVVTKRGRPVAQLAPVSCEPEQDWRGAMRGRGEILADLVEPAAGPAEWEALRE